MTAFGEMGRGVVMAGITGTRIEASLPRFGGYVLFGGPDATLDAVRALTDALREREGGPPPIIAIDQEGGAVARLREGVEPMPPMMALGAAGDVELAERAGEQTAFDLRRAGCTLDFAPVLDLALDPDNVVIGTRSFGADPARVALLGAAFARGMQRGGVLPCYKHFPGHGSTSSDSHFTLPVINVEADVLQARDLIPFAAVASDAPAMMSAHVVVRAFDAHRPATLSERILSELLRDGLRFRGALVTDCMEMEAVAARGSVDSALEALAAGADLLIFSHDLERAVAASDAVEAAVGTERLALERLQEAYRRAMRLRDDAAPPLPLDAFPPHRGIGREIARRAVTLIRGVPHVDPIATIAVSFGADGRTLDREAPAMEELTAPLDPSAEEILTLIERLDARRRRPMVLVRRAHLHPKQVEAVTQILDRYPDAVVVSLREPFDLALFPAARHLLAAYGDDLASIGGLADVVFGGSMPTGRLPVSN